VILMRAVLVCVALVAVCGCHTMRFNVANKAHGKVVFQRKSFYFWGLTPTRKVDVSEYCPAGVTAIREETSLSDVGLALVTLGIWMPRSSWYSCVDGGNNP